MNPFAVLGLEPDAPPEEVARAYRRLAKQWHPDRHHHDPAAERRMAEINAAYAQLRDRGAVPPPPPARRRRRPAGWWLAPEVRAAVGAELLTALQPREPVDVVARSRHAVLLLATDRRLLWLRDDAVQGRVRSLPYRAIARLEQRPAPLARGTAHLRVHLLGRRRPLVFRGLDPDAARGLALHATLRLPAARADS